MEEEELPITRLLFHAKRFVRFWQEEAVLKGQELENAILEYRKAIQIAFELRWPHKLFELFAEISRLATSFPLYLRFQIMLAYILIKYSAGRGARNQIEKALCALLMQSLILPMKIAASKPQWYPSC